MLSSKLVTKYWAMVGVLAVCLTVMTGCPAQDATTDGTQVGLRRVHIITQSLPNARVGVDYKAQLLAIGGRPPYTWAVSKGSLPGGLALDPKTGVISGMPYYEDCGLGVCPVPFTITVTDSSH